MGYDSSVYLLYGVRLNNNEAKNLMKRIIPNEVEKYGEDLLGCYTSKPHVIDGIKCRFIDGGCNQPEGGEIFFVCYMHEHVASRGKDDYLEVSLPSDDTLTQFKKICVDNGINQEPRYYTKLYESY